MHRQNHAHRSANLMRSDTNEADQPCRPPRVRCGEKRIKRRQSHSGEFAKQTGRVRVANATETNRGV
ncbi:hypothetical protein TGP89_313273 [Toxoplasma gondii p89]|uniref:Uncharacterized protein n=1 Tax=Toxoplasma gondii p89 TaxID=943119 RepID=A0A086L0B7_TOXGO|nr:hypothetical protein TGP89_313273 [Toxoplasma gondii p89]